MKKIKKRCIQSFMNISNFDDFYVTTRFVSLIMLFKEILFNMIVKFFISYFILSKDVD